MSAMNCRQCQEMLDQDAFASCEALPEEARAHLAQCETCRKRAEAAEKLAQCLASVRKTAAELPDAWLDENRGALGVTR